MTDLRGQLRLVEMVVFGRRRSGCKTMKFSGCAVERVMVGVLVGEAASKQGSTSSSSLTEEVGGAVKERRDEGMREGSSGEMRLRWSPERTPKDEASEFLGFRSPGVTETSERTDRSR